MSEENLALIRSTYEAFGRGDVPAVLGALDENIEWYSAEGLANGGLHRGPQAVAEEVFGALGQDFETFTVTPEEFYADGDEVVAIVRYRGTGAANGKSLDTPAVHAFTVRDGKVTRFRQFVDTVVYNEATGVGAAA